MKNKWLVLAIILAVALAFCAGAMAQRKFIIRLNDKVLKLDTIEINGKVWVPVSDMSNALGIRHRFNEEKGIIQLNAPARFVVAPNYVVNDDKSLKNRYYFKLSYAQGNFFMDVIVNEKKIGTYNAEADVEITKYLREGKNTVEVAYRFTGGNSGFYFALQEMPSNGVLSNVEEMDLIYNESSGQRTGKRTFHLDVD